MSQEALFFPIVSFITSLGGAGLIGMFCGAFLRKAFTIVCIIMGFIVFALGALSYKGIILINYQTLTDRVYDYSLIAANETQNIITFIAHQIEGNSLVIGTGGTFGFIAGFAFGYQNIGKH